MLGRRITMLGVSIFLGILLVSQFKAFKTVNQTLARENTDSVFQQLKILKDKNDSLRTEVQKLESNLLKLSDQESALQTVKSEIEDFKKLSGTIGIFGEGIALTFSGNIGAELMTDTINEMFNAGAQAVAVNSLRYTNKTAGFDVLPNGQIFYSGQILKAPFVFTAIGDSERMLNALKAQGGILQRIQEANKDMTIQIEGKMITQINSISQN